MRNPILDRLEERKSKQQYYTAVSQAQEIWDQQKEAIDEIKNTEGFKAIRSYFINEMEAAIDRLETTKAGDSHAQENLKITKKILSWLDSRA